MARRDRPYPVAGTSPEGASITPDVMKTPVAPEQLPNREQDATRPADVPQLGLQKTFQDTRIDPMTVMPAREGREFREDSPDTLNPTNERRGAVTNESVAAALKKFQ